MYVPKVRVLLLAIAVAVLIPATAGGQDPPQQTVTTPVIEAPPNPCPERTRQSTHAQHARYVFHRKRISAHNYRMLKHMRRCAYSSKAQRNMRRVERRERSARRARQRAARYAIPSGHPLRSIAQCESHGNPRAVSASGKYRGKYQFDYGTWASVGGSGDPAVAPGWEQDMRAMKLYRRSGATPWPVCGS
jgi:hypothetical protein